MGKKWLCFDGCVKPRRLRMRQLSEPTSELHLQDFVLIVDDVTVCVEGVAGTVHADFQTQIAAWWGAIIKHRHYI